MTREGNHRVTTAKRKKTRTMLNRIGSVRIERRGLYPRYQAAKQTFMIDIACVDHQWGFQ